MYERLKKSSVFPRGKNTWHRVHTPVFLLLVVLISSCIPTWSQQQYENPKSGIKLTMPRNWDVMFYERSGVIALETKRRIGNNDSAYIEIHGNACIATPSWFKNSHEEIRLNIERIRILYDLDSVTIIQEPTKIETDGKEVMKAVITVPTMSLPENTARNQFGYQDPNLFQTIELFAIGDKGHFIMAYIYKGSSNELNAQAEKIIASIRLICSK